jgi:hypothetical protein
MSGMPRKPSRKEPMTGDISKICSAEHEALAWDDRSYPVTFLTITETVDGRNLTGCSR